MIKSKRLKRHSKIRRKITGSSNRPRLAVFRSKQHIYAQIIDDTEHKTLVFESDLKTGNGTKKEKAYEIGKRVAQKAVKKNIREVVFDRGGFLYHGRIAELAKGAREGGLKF